MGAGRISGFAVAVFIHVARGQRSSRLAFTLADTAGIAAAEAEVRQLDLRDRNADEILPLLADQLSLRNVSLQVLLDLAADDLPESKIILLDVENHTDLRFETSNFEFQIIPSRLLARRCLPHNSTRRWRKCRNSCSSSSDGSSRCRSFLRSTASGAHRGPHPGRCTCSSHVPSACTP